MPIKCYSPELMVASVYNAAEFNRSISALNASKSEKSSHVEAIEKEQET